MFRCDKCAEEDDVNGAGGGREEGILIVTRQTLIIDKKVIQYVFYMAQNLSRETVVY